ncbi:MAG TPA: hypothetical protein VHI77_10885 [Solirubrobacterales bacterium]|jgi:hypothetical protein|nr:hypothetical protein [Solirubrobacterales bacterium]
MAGGEPKIATSRSGSELERASRGLRFTSAIAWQPQQELDQHQWAATGRRLGAIGRCSQWWIGDWIRYGATRWGERYAQAARITGYDVASLRNMAWVASRYHDLSLRSDKLAWSHHVLLAPLDIPERTVWLRRAVAERLSVADLRIELQGARRREDIQAVPAAAVERRVSSAASRVVCPQCGHGFPFAATSD